MFKDSSLRTMVTLSSGWLLLYATRTVLSSALKGIGDYWGLSQSYLGILSSAFFIVYMLLQIPSGYLADKFGPRRLLVLGFVVQSAGLFLGAIAQNPTQFLLSRALTGAGQATYFACQQAIISLALPPERRSLGTAATVAGAGFGSALGFVLGRFLATASLGWKTPFMFLSAVSLGFICVVRKFVPEPKRQDSFHTNSGKDVPAPKPRPAFLLCMCATHFLTMYGFYLMLTWLPYYLETVRGLQGTLSAVLPVVMPLIMAPATMIAGRIGDRWGRKPVLLVALPLASLSMALMPLSRGTGSLVGWLALYGAVGKLVIDPPVIRLVGENSPPHLRGTYMSILNFAGTLAMIIAPAVTGFLAESTGSFNSSFFAASVMNLFGLVTVLSGIASLSGPHQRVAGR